MEKKEVPATVKDKKLVEKRRRQITKGAVKLFKEKGFHRSTTREIAKEAGFSIGTLYEYIQKKEDVLYLVVDEIHDRLYNSLVEIIDVNKGDIDSLKEAIAIYFTVMDEMQDEVLVMYQESKSITKDALPNILQKELGAYHIFEQKLKQCVANGVLDLSEKEISLAAQNIVVKGHMWAFRRWILRKTFTLEEYIDLQLKSILKSIQ